MKAKLEALKNLAARARAKQAAAAAALSVAAVQAQAALPAEATAAITALKDDGTDMVAAGWPVLVAITGGLILMGIFKKVLSRAT
ncbi:major coat protein [Thauera sp. Sel9]|uniref:major coat protein n=1 Tax=Thauera sp. Sel9 TaxID=2974299 RepID=UPI0021E19FBF|nr:major coat protein [Thauera sp. Sel9]MCV2216221.1 hypothetical protein [Thauera sp. Sel9]